MEGGDIEKRLAEFRGTDLSEVHMVAGIHPDKGYEYYLDIVRGAKRGLPDVHVKAFTMVEIEHMLNISGKTEDEVFDDLREAGLGSCPGGGAEILVDRVLRRGRHRWHGHRKTHHPRRRHHGTDAAAPEGSRPPHPLRRLRARAARYYLQQARGRPRLRRPREKRSDGLPGKRSAILLPPALLA